MNKLDTLLQSKSVNPRLMTHFIAGYPTLEASIEIGRALVRGGSAILEIQIPFSDPVADGPSIIEACQVALKNAIRVDDVIGAAKTLASESNTPIVIVSYANPLYRYGITRFIEAAQKAGVSGVIIPDLPLDTVEGQELVAACRACQIHPILLISPGVSEKRLQELVPYASGFVYCTSRQGITGATSEFAADLSAFIESVRAIFKIPVAIGFGVKSKEDVVALSKLSDVVVAGSVFVNAITKNSNKNELGIDIEKLTRSLIS